MEVHFNPELQARLDKISAETGRSADELVQDATAGYLDELTQVRQMLNSRYAEIKDGKVKAVDGENVFARLRQKSSERRSDRK